MNLLARHVIFRALLRWTAAVAFCIPLKHRPHARLRALGMLLPLLGLTYVLDPAAQSTSLHELQFSLLTLYVAFFVLLGMMIYACVEIDKRVRSTVPYGACLPPRPLTSAGIWWKYSSSGGVRPSI